MKKFILAVVFSTMLISVAQAQQVPCNSSIYNCAEIPNVCDPYLYWCSGKNLALGASITASSSRLNAGANLLNDGKRATEWFSANVFPQPQVIQMDFSQVKGINTVVLKLPYGNATLDRIIVASIEVSNDNINWTTVIPMKQLYIFATTRNQNCQQAFDLSYPSPGVPATQARYLRIAFYSNQLMGSTAWNSIALPYMDMGEIQVFGN